MPALQNKFGSKLPHPFGLPCSGRRIGGTGMELGDPDLGRTNLESCPLPSLTKSVPSGCPSKALGYVQLQEG